MNNNSKTKNSTLNLLGNIVYQITILFLTFLIRRLYIKNLGIDYLGISGLFSNILELFSLAELGISGAISFSMYKYLAEKNEQKLKELNSYYKTLYNRIALIVLTVGLMIMPFLKFIIKLETEIPHIEIYYLINLLNSVFSYLFVYKTTIVYADQNDYKLKAINIFFELIKFVLQIIAIVVFKSYFAYLLVQILITFIGNLIRSKFAEKWYPFIKEKAELPEKEKKDLWINIKSMFFYKIGNSVMNHTDNILTSVIVNTTTVGMYSNYTTIYLKISSFINLIFGSVVASVGNLNVNSSPDKQYQIYKVLNFMAFILFSIASIGMWFISEDVIVAISDSSKYLLAKSILIITIINFYSMGILHPNTIFRQTSGLFKMAKYSMLICCILNIIFSIIFGYLWGLFGIIFASILSRLVTNIWYEPYILYKKFFHKNPLKYYICEILKIGLILLIILIMTPLINLISFNNLYVNVFVKFVICCIAPLFLIWIAFNRTEEYKFLVEKGKIIINYAHKLKNKINR